MISVYLYSLFKFQKADKINRRPGSILKIATCQSLKNKYLQMTKLLPKTFFLSFPESNYNVHKNETKTMKVRSHPAYQFPLITLTTTNTQRMTLKATAAFLNILDE